MYLIRRVATINVMFQFLYIDIHTYHTYIHTYIYIYIYCLMSFFVNSLVDMSSFTTSTNLIIIIIFVFLYILLFS